jgi:hypothetical protein
MDENSKTKDENVSSIHCNFLDVVPKEMLQNSERNDGPNTHSPWELGLIVKTFIITWRNVLVHIV